MQIDDTIARRALLAPQDMSSELNHRDHDNDIFLGAAAF